NGLPLVPNNPVQIDTDLAVVDRDSDLIDDTPSIKDAYYFKVIVPPPEPVDPTTPGVVFVDRTDTNSDAVCVTVPGVPVSAANPYNSIQEAISRSAAGSTIYVRSNRTNCPAGLDMCPYVIDPSAPDVEDRTLRIDRQMRVIFERGVIVKLKERMI